MREAKTALPQEQLIKLATFSNSLFETADIGYSDGNICHQILAFAFKHRVYNFCHQRSLKPKNEIKKYSAVVWDQWRTQDF